MITIVEIPKTDKEELLKQDFMDEVYYDLLEPKKLIGAEEIIQWVVELTAASIPVIAAYILSRKKKQQPTRIIVEGIAIEYSSKEELEVILNKLLEKKEK